LGSVPCTTSVKGSLLMRFHAIPVLVLTLLINIPPVSAQTNVVISDRVAGTVRIDQVAKGLDFPMGMTILPDNSLLVATSPSDGGNFYNSTGALVRLVDSDGNGSLDQQNTLIDGLPGSLVAVARYGEIVIATSAQSGSEQIMFFRRGAHWKDPLSEVASINFAFGNQEHQSYALATRKSSTGDDAFELFFNIGSTGNVETGPPVQTSGTLSDLLDSSSIYMVTVEDDGSGLTMSETTQIAKGLRNGTTLAFNPATGDLWIGENGIDGLDDPLVSFSADELDVVKKADIGKNVIDFGFPDAYIDYASGEAVGKVTDTVDSRPHNGSESEGVAGITFVPDTFPGVLSGELLAGFHGQFDETGIENEENPLVSVDPTTGEKFDLISNDSPGVGHLDSMAAMDDVIYIADLCNASLTGSVDGCGVIYALRPADGTAGPVPPTEE
jgi:glucose/arabinose dehydrogenase